MMCYVSVSLGVVYVDPRLETALAIGIGGLIGANARYWISVSIAEQLGRALPWGTLFVNITGSFLLAVFVAWSARQIGLSAVLRLSVVVGFFGAYTTYSSFANETIALLQNGEWSNAAIYIVGTNLLCIVGVIPGLLLGSRL